MAAPTLTGMQETFSFYENTVNVFAALLDGNVTFSDADLNMAGGTLSITGGNSSEDWVWVRNLGTGAGQIGVTGDRISYGGVEFASIRASGGSTFVTFTSAVTVKAIEALIENLTYTNLSDTPTPTRVLTLNLRDAAGVPLNAPEMQIFAELTGAANPFVAYGTTDPLQTGLNASPIMLDFDGDGDLDLAMGASNIWLPGYVASPQGFSGPYQDGPLTGLAPPSEFAFLGAHLAVGPDLNADYRPLDLVIGLADGTLVGYGRAASWGFGDNSIRWNNYGFLDAADPFAGIDVGNYAAPTFADIDGDGDADLIAGAADGLIRLFDNNDYDHRFTEMTEAQNPFAGIDLGDRSAPVFLNLDDDGDLDMVAGSADGTLRAFRRNGDGTWSELTGAANPFAGIDVGTNSAPNVAHLDGDGLLDLIVGSGDGRVIGLRNATPQSGIALTISVIAQPDHQIQGSEGNDTLVGLIGSNVIHGLGGDDLIRGNSSPDRLFGDDGSDIVDYRVSNAAVFVDLDRSYGAGGHAQGDYIQAFEGAYGSAYNDTLLGDYTHDQLHGGSGADVIAGRAGNDIITGSLGADTLKGGEGIDQLSYRKSLAGVRVDLVYLTASGGQATGDIISGFENISGSDFADTLTGNAAGNVLSGWMGKDVIRGGGGKDFIEGGTGADVLSGGSGIDTLSYGLSGSGVTVNLAERSAAGGEATGDVISGFERVIGSQGNDILVGDITANQLFGLGGDDRIYGGSGADQISGGAGADLLSGGLGFDTLDYSSSSAGINVNLATGRASGGDARGDSIAGFEAVRGSAKADVITGNATANVLLGGAGADRFVFASALGGANVDRLLDYTSAEDRILLDNAVFTGLSEGVLAEDAYRWSLDGSAATTAAHRIIFDVLNNTLWFDVDGVGGQAGVLFATGFDVFGFSSTQFLVI